MSAPSILTLAASGQASEVLRDLRVRSLYSSFYFVKVVLGYSKLSASFHLPEMERFLTLWTEGHSKQGIEWARGFYKTTCYTVGTGIWVTLPPTEEDTEYALHKLGLSEEQWYKRVALHDQDVTQLLAFETEANAKKKLSIIKWHFEENTLFRQVFPEIAYTGKEVPWNNNSLRIRRVGERRMSAEGTFDAIGVGGALQSRHYKIIWEDDLVGEAAIKSPAVMEDTIGWHGRLAGAFEHSALQNRFLISNRWGYADLNSHIRAQEADVVWHTRSAIEIGPEGEEIAPFPEEYSLERVGAIRDSKQMTAYNFSCQYLNSPVMPGEKEVATEALHFYRVEEDGTIVCETCQAAGATLFMYRASQLNRYIHYDPYNAKGPASTSLPAIAVVGTSQDKHVFLLDYALSKDSYGRVYDRIFRYNDVWRPSLFTYEDVGHQNMTAFHIQEISKTSEFKRLHKPFPRIQAVATANKTKEVRVREGLFPVIEKKRFACRRKHQLFLSMLSTFPHHVLTHDYDLLDALSQGASVWRYPIGEEELSNRRLHEDTALEAFNSPYGVAGIL